MHVLLPIYISSRIPITSAMKDTMFAVSRTVSPCAICDFFSSRSCTSRPRRLHAEAKEKRVRVELSRKIEIPRPLSNTFCGNVVFSHETKCICYGKYCFEFFVGFCPMSRRKLVVIHFFEVKFVEFVDVIPVKFSCFLLLGGNV